MQKILEMVVIILTTVLTYIVFFTGAVPLNNSDVFELSIIHINDFHSRFEEISDTSAACKTVSNNCIGGFSRIYTAIKQLIREHPNSIILNGGDNFQGTLWYTIYRWNVTQHFLNQLPFHAYTLGNHEFDHGITGLLPFLRSINAPVVASNIDDNEELEIQGLYNKSILIERNGRTVGVIGVISQYTHLLSNTGKLKFLDESASVNKEAKRLVAENKVDTIIVLSHCGYEADKLIARNAAPKIGLIVGAHSHTFLFSGHPLPGLDKPKGPYPTVVTHDDGRNILIVQASALSKYVGNLTVRYNNQGNAISWSGAPVYLNNDIKQDDGINTQLQSWKEGLEAQGNITLGYSNVFLKHGNCRYAECNLGNLITDAMVSDYLTTDEEDAWTYAAVALINSGGIKSSISQGNITYSDLILTLPFGNTFDVGEIQGKYLKAAFEYALGNDNHWGGEDMNLLQVSGLNIVYNLTKAHGSRVDSIRIRCRECRIPIYEELNVNKFYRIVINSFLASGGEGHAILSDHVINRKIGHLDIDVFQRYVVEKSPLVQELEGRIRIVH